MTELERLIKQIPPKELALGLMRSEAEEDEHRRYYRKGAKSMLNNFVEDFDYINEVMEEFDKIYEE